MDVPQLAAALRAAEAADSSAEAMSETEHASVMQQRQQQGLQFQPVPQQQDGGLVAGPADVHSSRQQEAAAAGLRMAVLTSAARLLEAKVTVVYGATTAQCTMQTYSGRGAVHPCADRGDGGPRGNRAA